MGGWPVVGGFHCWSVMSGIHCWLVMIGFAVGWKWEGENGCLANSVWQSVMSVVHC